MSIRMEFVWIREPGSEDVEHGRERHQPEERSMEHRFTQLGERYDAITMDHPVTQDYE